MESSQLVAWSQDPLSKQHFQKCFLSSPALVWVFPWLNQLPNQIPSVENWQALNIARSPLHLGPDIRKWLRKHSNGYQIFGNWLSFPGQAMCLGEMESLIITWPCDRPKVALFTPGKKRRKEMYQLAQWCRCTIMLEETADTLLSRCLTWWCTGNTKKPRGSAASLRTADSLACSFSTSFLQVLEPFYWPSSGSEQRTEDLSITSLSLKYNCMAVSSNRRCDLSECLLVPHTLHFTILCISESSLDLSETLHIH